MSVPIVFYTHSKKLNSTAQPSGGSSYDCFLKEPCGSGNPVVVLQYSLTASPTAFNYCNIPIFNRYYWITDWTYDAGLWYATCTVDVLASWKPAIGAGTAYILRCADNQDRDISDMLYPIKSTLSIQRITGSASPPWISGDASLSSGTYVVGIAGASTTYYSFGAAEYEGFMRYIMSADYADTLVGDWQYIFTDLNAQIQPLQYITSIMWFPFMVIGAYETINVGWVEVDSGGTSITDTVRSQTRTVMIPKHPQATLRGEYLNNAPFSKYELVFPPFGQISLSSNNLANVDMLYLETHVDMVSGMGVLYIRDENNNLLSRVEGKIGVNIQASQIYSTGTFDGGKAVGVVASAVPSMASGDYIGLASGLTTGIMSGIKTMAQGSMPNVSTIGSNGGAASLEGNIELQGTFYEVADDDWVNSGRPYCKVETIGSHTGFVMGNNVSINAPCSDGELRAIISYVEGGIYYE